MKGTTTPKALVLFSGGLDSRTVLSVARAEGFEPVALIFRYGQRHAVEVDCAVRLVSELGIDHRIVDLDLRSVGGSALTTDGVALPRDRDPSVVAGAPIPPTYVPARNTIFLSHALAWAEVLGIADIYIGINALDYSGYPDCRPEYLEAFERMANLATKAAVEGGARLRIHTPLIRLSKAAIVRLAASLGVDFSLTHSCYDPGPDGRPCGACDSCLLRRKGFEEAGIEDR
jgi:7-cyano-7-deazaguanine synthase